MTPEDVKLREAALAATPGPWHAVETRQAQVVLTIVEPQIDVCKQHVRTGRPPVEARANAAYIAAANPATILQLLDRVEAAERKAARAQGYLDEAIPDMHAERAKLLDEVERLRAALTRAIPQLADNARFLRDMQAHAGVVTAAFAALDTAKAALQPSGAGK